MAAPGGTMPIRGYAGLAGVLYLVIIVFGLFGELGVRMSLVVPGDAAATAANILGSETRFRLGFLAESIMALCDIGLAVLLFVILSPVNQVMALAAAAFRAIQTAVIAANLINHHAVLLILTGSDRYAALGPEQRDALALLSLDLQAHGYDLALIFFGVANLLLGYLVYRSGYLPRLLGLLLAAGGVVYILGSYLRFLMPEWLAWFEPAYAIPLVAEVGFCLWLLIRAVDPQKWQERTS